MDTSKSTKLLATAVGTMQITYACGYTNRLNAIHMSLLVLGKVCEAQIAN